jgi:four helix bundle protein
VTNQESRAKSEAAEPRDLRERLVDYSARIVRLVGALPRTIAGRHIADQLLRSATSVGANYEEAQAGESKNDFVHKLQIALKELRESNYWLRLIERSGILPAARLREIVEESGQLRAILSKAVATARGKSKHQVSYFSALP